jgi:hypothetical protein
MLGVPSTEEKLRRCALPFLHSAEAVLVMLGGQLEKLT